MQGPNLKGSDFLGVEISSRIQISTQADPSIHFETNVSVLPQLVIASKETDGGFGNGRHGQCCAIGWNHNEVGQNARLFGLPSISHFMAQILGPLMAVGVIFSTNKIVNALVGGAAASAARVIGSRLSSTARAALGRGGR